ncbi:MAG: hypothetical protein ACP5J4_15885 [Anaerolineae bacterium]
MATCQICNQDKPVGEEKKLYTAKILKEERSAERMTYGGGREVDVTTTYGEFMEHNYFLCSACQTLWDKIVMWAGIGLTVVTTIVLLAISIRQHIDWMFALALVVLIAGFIVTGELTTRERLKRQAKRARGDGPFKAFSASEYAALLEKQSHG